MVRRRLALSCAAALCLWLLVLALVPAAGGPQREAAAPAQGAFLAAAGQGADLSLPCRAAILVDQATGTVLYEKNADQPMPIASITKVMTLLLTFEAVHAGKFSLSSPVPVSAHAAGMGGSQIWLEPGEQFTLDEMLRAICVSSANDAAVAVAELVGGSEGAFVALMNAKAAQLGMSGTTFKNACGLDTEGHLSTARDVAVMSRAILTECPEVLHYSGIWTDTLRGGETMLVNTNKLLRRYDGITGLKTGTTGGAGVCISASASRDGLDLIAVVLGSNSSAERFEAATALLDYGFASYEAAPLPDLSQRPLRLAVDGGAAADVPLDYSALPGRLLVPRGGAEGLAAAVELPGSCSAPLKMGEEVGAVTVTSGGQTVGRWPVRAAADAPRMDFAAALRLLCESFF
ncbi:MAG TPA: D-alanyl-D-alanine carboxypeptidase [Candidatus Faecalibacterium faecipullorum]|uniref:serine-type D-Ala-D-Ala carboxypeptidase n=1 Tax=Candidatus Faecalibacterium faecipullorum TaxID=2838578 RepID=A0A9D2MFP8_9FIRM|nr:D-alanyl-D-alanine carboxypeptidase [Candidatus Faecalibacterium faecipullorum]